MELRASVVIPTYQRRDSVLRALEALSRQAVSPDDFEVIVVVDGSTDGTLQSIGEYRGVRQLKVISQENQGRAAACNAGIREARASLVVFLDDDMEPEKHWIEAHVEAHRSAVPMAVVGAAPIDAEQARSPSARFVTRKFNAHMRLLAQPGREFQLRDFYSGNCSVPLDALTSIGGFDEQFTRYGNEDLDLSIRLRRAGVTIVFSERAAARQHYLKDMRSLALDNRAKGFTAVQLWRKHPETFSELKLSRYGEGSRLSRALRATLLALSNRWQNTPDVAIWIVSAVGRMRFPGADRLMRDVLDYFYWMGVRDAQIEMRRE